MLEIYIILSANQNENWRKETAEKIISYCSFSISEKDGIYSCEEWQGTLKVMNYTIEIGKEFLLSPSGEYGC